jgi:hypothetical protein
MSTNKSISTRQWTAKTANRPTGSSHHCGFGDLYARFRLEKSLFGYTPSVLKSGLQRYARRAEVKKGLWCLQKTFIFS